MDEIHTAASGNLKISEDVISTVTKLTVKEVKGVHSLALSPANLKDALLKVDANRPIRISLNGDVAQIDISVNLRYGFKIREVAEEIQTSVKDAVQNMTGVTVSKVNVYVAGVKFREDASDQTVS